MQVAGHPVIRRRLQQPWSPHPALLHRVGAARVKMAAARRIDGARDVTLENDAILSPAHRIRDGHGGEQGLRVRVQRRAERHPQAARDWRLGLMGLLCDDLLVVFHCIHRDHNQATDEHQENGYD